MNYSRPNENGKKQEIMEGGRYNQGEAVAETINDAKIVSLVIAMICERSKKYF
jgi:hypothetical protein